MTIKEARALKAQFQHDIMDMIAQFEVATGLVVQDIRLMHFDEDGKSGGRTCDLDVTVLIP